MKNSNSLRPRRTLFDRFFSYLDQRKPSDRLLFVCTLLVLAIALAITLLTFNKSTLETFPTSGGIFTEGILGTPRFVNPVLAITPSDYDLITLLYSGLLTLGTEGKLENDLAESITISDDGIVYNIILRENIFFHDGEAIHADDVAFTIGLIQSPELKSPLRGSWSGVTIEVISEREFNLVLEQPYVPFKENLTLGILPKHIWESLTLEELPFSQYNVEPIGSGPYKLKTIKRNLSGLIEEYQLVAVDSEKTNITDVRLRFYQKEADVLADLKKGEILGTASLAPESIKHLNAEKFAIFEEPLPRVFSVFINQNRTAALRDQGARMALSTAIDRADLIEKVLDGYGIPTLSPVPNGFNTLQSNSTTSTSTTGIEAARLILEKAGWEQADNGRWLKDIEKVETVLAISIATGNSPTFEATAAYLERVWTELGVEVSVALFEQSDLVQAVIRPRDYQALLFGTDIGRSLDLYPFWHSSQRSDPGLNVAMYANITTDNLLNKSRIEQNTENQQELILQVAKEIQTESPAIFLFNPTFVYVVNKTVNTNTVSHLSRASERFSTISQWYMAKEDVWPIFKK